MNYLYLILDLGSLIIPFLFSFHPKLKFYNYWKSLFIGILVMMAIFIPWDIIFTTNGIWGFNKAYLIDLEIANLPIEEWLFFICIPYACIFTHYSLKVLFPMMELEKKYTTIITHVLVSVLAVLCVVFYDRWYTLVNFLYAIFLILIVMYLNFDILKRYYLTYLIILIPFFIVNGLLTGSFIENEIVWYNNSENLGIRILTIPIEDTIYAFSMLLTVLFITELLQNKGKTKTPEPKTQEQ